MAVPRNVIEGNFGAESLKPAMGRRGGLEAWSVGHLVVKLSWNLLLTLCG